MASQNTPPSMTERAVMWDLYREIGTYKGVANHDEVDYSRESVRKWINRIEDGEEDWTHDIRAEVEDDYVHPDERGGDDGDGGGPDEDFSDIIEETPDPNDILLDICTHDPQMKEKHIDYLKNRIDFYGVLSTNDLRTVLDRVKITNKNQTIERVVTQYAETINKHLREDPDIQYEEPWRTLVTKETGQDPARGVEHQVGNQAEIQTPPPSTEPMGNQGVSSPQPPAQQTSTPGPNPGQQQPANQSPGGQQTQASIQSPAQHPQPTQPAQGPAQSGVAPQQSGGGQSNSLSPMEQKLLEIVEEKMDDDEDQQPAQAESSGDAMDEMMAMYRKMQQLQQEMGQNEDGDTSEVEEQLGEMMQHFEQRMQRIEQKVAEDNSDDSRSSTSFDLTGMGDAGGDMMAMASLAEMVEDEDTLQTIAQMQMDPEIIKARAEMQQMAQDQQIKQQLLGNISPATVDKAVDSIFNMTQAISNAGGSGGQDQQPAQQPPQQPAQPQQAREGQVEVVDQGQQQAQPVQQAGADQQSVEDTGSDGSDPRGETPSGGPLREEGIEDDDEPTDSGEVEVAGEENEE